ncbi:MAG: DUF3108 domain-containing protein [Bdellovibrionota bacterium]
MILSLTSRAITRALLLSLLTSLAPALRAADDKKAAPPPEEKPECKPEQGPTPEIPRAETYKGLPFQPGEEIRYVLKYGSLKVHVGYGYLRVQAPVKQPINTMMADGKIVQESRWHRVYAGEAYTGDWYKYIFAGHDSLQSFARPWDSGVTKFYISQNEEKPFVRRTHLEKWLDFDHSVCTSKQKLVDHKKKKEKYTEAYIDPKSIDAMSAAYKLRTFDYQLNKTERFMVYTSDKNWWLEATPTALETVNTAIGSHKAFKLTVKTFLGKELQQKGNLYVWIAQDHPQHPIVKIQGEVTFGSIYMEIDRFVPGTPLDGSATGPAKATGGPETPNPPSPDPKLPVDPVQVPTAKPETIKAK